MIARCRTLCHGKWFNIASAHRSVIATDQQNSPNPKSVRWTVYPASQCVRTRELVSSGPVSKTFLARGGDAPKAAGARERKHNPSREIDAQETSNPDDYKAEIAPVTHLSNRKQARRSLESSLSRLCLPRHQPRNGYSRHFHKQFRVCHLWH